MKSISGYFGEDHDRLDKLFSEYQSLKRKDHPAAKEKFKEFIKGLTRHIVWEEDVLFPLFEKKTGLANNGPTEVMRAEHRLIGKYLEAIHDKVKMRNPESDEEEQLLVQTLHSHNHKEELILYPAIDRQLIDKEIEAVFATMQSIPEERYHTCCHADAHKHTT